MQRFLSLRRHRTSLSLSPSTSSLHTHLSNPSDSANASSYSHRFHHYNPSFSRFPSTFHRFFSSGYSSNRASLRRLLANPTGFSFIKRSRSFSSETGRESMEYDVVIVGAGPAGLSAGIRLKQLCRQRDVDLSVCVVEKGPEVGAHILSGNVFEPRALDELLPQWKEEEAPINVPVSSDKFWYLTKDRAISLPSPFHNRGNYVISLSQLVRWMGVKAEELGVEIYPGFSASEVLYDTNNKVIGIGTNDMGIAKDGSKKDTFQRGVELRGRVTLLAEGCRGSLSEVCRKEFVAATPASFDAQPLC